MFEYNLTFPNGKEQLFIKEESTGHYTYKYSKLENDLWERKRRWEWHCNHGKPHVHYHDNLLGVVTKKSEKYSLANVLEEIKQDYNPLLNTKLLLRIVEEKRK
jgi:hypothetical protein